MWTKGNHITTEKIQRNRLKWIPMTGYRKSSPPKGEIEWIPEKLFVFLFLILILLTTQ